jgi:hypothetical protein
MAESSGARRAVTRWGSPDAYQLRRNLETQVEVYKKASDAEYGYKVILYFSDREYTRVQAILRDLALEDDPHVVLVDARSDNKPSGSKA